MRNFHFFAKEKKTIKTDWKRAMVENAPQSKLLLSPERLSEQFSDNL